MSETQPSVSPGPPVRQPDDPARAGDTAPKPRKKRAPRPTYDDGALTRVFKFPSKKFPKSSYYVTDTEIIIRIRKARKKWKLVLPKKRVVSCRTNRWFTKPRWIEIELTYTQAVRQGLIERTPQPLPAEAPPEANNVAAATLPAGDEAASIDAFASMPPEPVELAPENEPEGEAEAEFDSDGDVELDDGAVTGWVPDDDADPAAGEELGDADDDEFADDPVGEVVATPSFEWETVAAGSDAAAPESLAWVEAIQPLAPHADAPPVAISLVEPDDAETTPLDKPLPPLMVRRPASRTRRFAGAGLMAAALAMAFLVFGGDWSNVADTVADRGPCTDPLQATCADYGIVTGSISVAPEPSGLATAQEPAFGDPARAEPVRDVSAVQAVAMPSREAEANEPVAPPPIDEASHPDVRAEASPPAAVAVVAAAQPIPTPAAIDPCPARAASIVRSTVIQFGYASASLTPPGVAALDPLAMTLEQCPAVRVIIEGHTDSDGDYYRNQSLSVRRAEAVRQHLVNAGATPGQLSVIGYGQLRPLMPNDTSTNKSRNRRIEIVVE